jgi:hypothetical protein
VIKLYIIKNKQGEGMAQQKIENRKKTYWDFKHIWVLYTFTFSSLFRIIALIYFVITGELYYII